MARSGGTLGQIEVDYRIVYLPAGVTVPVLGESGTVIQSDGSIMMGPGQTLVDVSQNLFSNAFTEPGAQLYIEIVRTELLAGGRVPLLQYPKRLVHALFLL